MGDVHDLSDDSYFDKDYFCEICSMWCTTEDELITHMQDHHREKTDSVKSDSLACNFCEEKFVKHGDLMKHKKRMHEEKVALCWKFSAGICALGDTIH